MPITASNSRRPSTGGLPPIRVQSHLTLSPHPTSRRGTPHITIWQRDEIIDVPKGYAASDFDGLIADALPDNTITVYDTRLRAGEEAWVRDLARNLWDALCAAGNGTEKGVGIEVVGLSMLGGEKGAGGVGWGDRVERCRAHCAGGRGEEESVGGVKAGIWTGEMWGRAIVVVGGGEDGSGGGDGDEEEIANRERDGMNCGKEDEAEVGIDVRVVYWDLKTAYRDMLVKEYGEGILEKYEIKVDRVETRELGSVLAHLAGTL